MKLRREISLFFGKATPIFRGWVFLVVLFVGMAAKAQTVSVLAGTGDGASGAEVLPPNEDGASFTISLSNPSFEEEYVNYDITGTATNGEDYTELSGRVRFPPGTVSVTIPVIIIDDAIVENTESVTITLTDATSPYRENTTPATVQITDNDIGVISLDLTSPTFDPNASEEGQDIGRFRIVLDKPNGTATDITVNYQLTVDGQVWDEVSDFTLLPVQEEMTFANNSTQTARNLRITPIDDSEIEGAETITLTLMGTNSGLFSIGTPNSAEVTIEDNDCAAGATAPPIDNSTATEFCNPPDASVDLNSFVTGGTASAPANATLRWSTNATPTMVGNLLPDATADASGTYYAVYVADADSCFSPVSEAVEIIFNAAPSAGTLVNPSPIAACNNETDDFGPNQINLNSLVTGQDAGGWSQSGGTSVGAIPANNTIDFIGRDPGNYEFTYTTTGAVAPCTNASSVVTITVTDCDPCTAGNTAPVLTDGVMTTFCGDITASLNDYAPNEGPNGTVLRWATDNADPINNLVPPNRIDNPLAGTYYGFYYDAANDCASPLLTLSLVQNETPVITGSTESSRCGPGTLQLSVTANLDATIRWYTAATGGSPVRTGANFTTPNISRTTSYFAEATANGCVSERTEVVATVVPQPSAGAPRNASSCNDVEFGVTILDLDDTFSATPGEGAWSFTSGPSAISLNAENVVDFQGSANGNYVFTYTTNSAQAPCENATAAVTIAVSSCDTDDDGDGLLGGLEAMLGTDPNDVDTDGDGINDNIEVGDDTDNPLDEDEDGIIDALDSNTEDVDQDGVNDQQDPANNNACVPNRFNGQCDTDGDGVSDLEERDNGSDPDDACSPNATPDCADPIDLQVVKEVDQLDAVVDDNVVFTVTVNNLSDRKALNVIVGDLLETGFQIDSTATTTASNGEYDVRHRYVDHPRDCRHGFRNLNDTRTGLGGRPLRKYC